MKAKTTGLLLLACGAVAVVLVLQNCVVTPDDDAALAETPAPPVEVAAVQQESSTEVSATASVERTEAVTNNSPNENPSESDAVRLSEREAFYNRFDLSQIGSEPIDDGEFNALLAYLRNDPELLAQFLAEYRANTDPERARWLAAVLEEFDDVTITTLAEEMVYSGNVDSQIAGLDLLGGQQENSPEARDIVSEVLEIETNPVVISSALNALAKPGDASAAQREKLLSQFAMHSSSEDAAIRSRSLSLMKRWAGDADMNEFFIAGLQDPDEGVRSSSLLALRSTKHPSDAVYQGLLSVVENSNESKQSRRTALFALDKYGLSAEEKQRYLDMMASGN